MANRSKKVNKKIQKQKVEEIDVVQVPFHKKILSDKSLQILIAITLLGTYLRIHNLGTQSIWLDEAVSYELSHVNSVSLVWTNAMADKHPPLHFLILHFVSIFSSSEFMLRLPSAVFGILTIPMIYKTGESLFGKKEGLISAFILSISSIHIFYSQEARMYAQMVLFSIVSLYFLYRAYKENKNWLWAGFVISASLGFYSFYYTIFVLVPEILFYIIIQLKDSIRSRRIVISDMKNVRSFVLSMIIFLILISPVLMPFISQSLERTSGVPTWGLGQSSDFVIVILKQFSTYTNTSYVFVMLFIIGFIASMFNKTEREQAMLLGLMFSVPFIASYVLAANMPFVPRHMLFILPIYVLAISRGITGIANFMYQIPPSGVDKLKMSRLAVMLMLTCLIALLCLQPLSSYYSTSQKNDWGEVSNYFNDVTNPGDVIVSLPGYMATPLKFYYDYSGTQREGASSAETLENINSKYEGVRIWYVVTWDIRAANPEGDALNWLGQNTQMVNQITGVYILTNK